MTEDRSVDAAPVGTAHEHRPNRALFSSTLGDIAVPFLLHEMLFFTVAAFAITLLPAYAGTAYPTWHTSAPPLVDASWRWDGQWYASIALDGYRLSGQGYQNVAFFPLYPLLVRVTALPWGDLAIPFTGAIIPRLAFFGALVYLYLLGRLEYGRDVASRCILYIALYPTALFFSAAYAESLFLLTSVACFYHARRRQWWLAGGWGFLGALTRLQGLLLVIPLVYEIWQQAGPSKTRQFQKAFAISLVPAGLLVFMAYLQWSFHDPLAFYHSQGAWLRSMSAPYDTLVQAIHMGIVGEPDRTRRAMGLLNTAAALLFCVLGLLALRRLRLSYALYTLTALAIPLSSPVPDMPTVSMARFTVVLFPVFFLLAEWGRHRHVHHLVLAISIGLFSLLTALFVNWYWVV